jgi:RecB family exonuclease
VRLINGRFDRVDNGPDGIVIMDFKTSAIKTQKEADERVRKSLQLQLYSLAYGNLFKVFPKRVALYFLESGIIGSAEIEEDSHEEIKEKIAIVSQGLRGQNFQATPAYMACTYCAYNQICPFATIK